MQPANNKQMKRFVASSMRRALDLVRDELGPDAVILSSKKVPEGVEVITAVETEMPTPAMTARQEFGGHFDTELDTAMSSDMAWQMQAGVEQAAAHYEGRLEMNQPGSAPLRKGEQLAMEIERARERMLAAKREANERQSAFDRYHEPRTGAERKPSKSSAGVQATVFAEQEQQFAPGSRRARQADLKQNYHTGFDTQPDQRGFAHQTPQHSAQPRSREAMPSDFQQQAHYRIPEMDSLAQSGGAIKNDQENQRLEQLQSELADMRMILEQQLWRMGQQQQPASAPSQINMPVGFNVLHDHMARLGIPEDLAQRLLSEAGTHDKVSKTWRQCMARLAHDIPVQTQDMVEQGGIFAFVGQTGVGKTTTIAKLAARYVLKHGAGKVALVTTDTYRVGAYDQLRSLGRILNVPVRAVDGENSLITVLAKLKQFPLILIDTAGFRHGDPLLKDQLRKLDSYPAIQKVLVMACNSQLQTMKASTHAYNSARPVEACVLTKLDEAASLGEAISVVLERQIPVAYTTDGQEIPKDITQASGHKLIAAAVAMLKQPSDSGVLQSV